MAIQSKDWPALAAQFSDASHQQVAAYFQECQKVAFSVLQEKDLIFFARFRDFAEIGEITFGFENGKYRQLVMRRNIEHLNFIHAFSRYDVSDRTVRMGDAEIFFKKGVIYQGMPMGSVFIFSGEWTFRIRPEDEEERLTLGNLVHSERFEKESRAGIFVFGQPDLVSGLPRPQPVVELEDGEAKLLFDIFRKNWGMPIPIFKELWYFPFAAEFNLAMFYRKTQKSYFRYIFNPRNSPDTSLVLFPENTFYLNYNAVKGLKYTAQAVDELEKLSLSLFYNPQSRFLSGISVLNFKEPSNVKTINLDPGLVVKDFGKSQQQELQLFHRDDTYFLLGRELKKFIFYYAGSINASEKSGEMIKIDFKVPSEKNINPYYVLSREQNFYPNPGHNFFKSRIKISLPHPLQCLASGKLSSQKKNGERNEFVFESPGTKGVSLVCGNFEKLLTIPSQLPIHVFGNAKLKIGDYFSPLDVQNCFDFLLEKYGPLELSELNLLLRHHQDYGGLSYQGFVIFNLLANTFQMGEPGLDRYLRRNSPVVFNDIIRDNLVHELAHQWWGGVISWRSYQDQWLTEGLAQFSTMLYLENTLGESQFRKAIASAKKWVFRKNDFGPIFYGRRIANLSDDLYTFQSIVYNKAALVFLMLKEILGEEEMLKRLREILTEFRYQSLATARFIQQFSHGRQLLRKFFKGWIYSRQLPEVSYKITRGEQNAEIVFSQKNSDFVFPVSVRITTAAGKYLRTLIVEEKVQKFMILENTPILSIEVEAPVSPINLSD